ncbi:hypothetical protein CEXT_459551 [Caerostris extrusa]|uniref:Uncharacterized protein n=1 Tax=Caerostris extrusa TaxID=172846 RepID=A0AAV4QWN2_CAEEX|nr:hypothetical protein CEXT_459551 [Caerostris extrusa]
MGSHVCSSPFEHPGSLICPRPPLRNSDAEDADMRMPSSTSILRMRLLRFPDHRENIFIQKVFEIRNDRIEWETSDPTTESFAASLCVKNCSLFSENRGARVVHP